MARQPILLSSAALGGWLQRCSARTPNETVYGLAGPEVTSGRQPPGSVPSVQNRPSRAHRPRGTPECYPPPCRDACPGRAGPRYAWRRARVGLRRGRPGGAQGVHARRGWGTSALAWPRHRRACARTEPPPASHPSALSPLNMEAPPRVPEGCNRPMTTVPDVCSPRASGLRLRPAARPAWSPPALTSRWRGG
jgi:hypothetical protein